MIQENFNAWSLKVLRPLDFQNVMDYFLSEKFQLVFIDIQLPA